MGALAHSSTPQARTGEFPVPQAFPFNASACATKPNRRASPGRRGGPRPGQAKGGDVSAELKVVAVADGEGGEGGVHGPRVGAK
jgi:hypothetical protein